MTSLALPRLDALTPAFTLRSDTTFAGPLAQALLRAGKIPQACANDDVPKTYRAIAERALQEIWTQAMHGLYLFAWRMYLLAPQSYGHYLPAGPWFHIEPVGHCDEWPEVFIGPSIERLEAVKAGLGQTVLAVLYDALRYLPQTLTPETALALASYLHWHGGRDETEAADWMVHAEGYTSREQALADQDFFTRAEFFASMPEWAATPRRVLTQHQVRRAARIDPFAADVIGACDAIHQYVCDVRVFPDMNFGECECDAIGFSAFIRWNYNDPVLRLFDDYGNQAVQADYVEAATVVPISLAGDELSRWLDGLQHVGELARRVEALLVLVAEQPEDRVTNRVQVRA